MKDLFMKTYNNFRTLLRAFSLMVLLLAIPASSVMAQLPKVLILTWEYLPYAQDAQTKLIATHEFSQVDLYSIGGGQGPIPTLAFLKGYDAVLYWTSYGVVTGLGTILAQYVDSGGGVVFAAEAVSNGYGLDANFSNSTYRCIDPNVLYTSNSPYLTIGPVALPTHPIMQNVYTFSGGSAVRTESTTIESGAYIVAFWSSDGTAYGSSPNNIPLIIARENAGINHNRRRVDLNFYPPSSDIFTQNGGLTHGWSPMTDGARIMANALTWVSPPGILITNPADKTIQSLGIPLTPTIVFVPNLDSVRIRFQITPAFVAVPVYTYDTVLKFAVKGVLDTIHFPSFTPTALGDYVDSVMSTNLGPGANTATAVETANFVVGYPNSIQAVSFVDPLPNSLASAGTLTPIIVNFKNIGGNNQANAPVTAVIKDSLGNVVYRDTEYAVNWLSNQSRQVQFVNWFLPGGTYTFYGISLLPTDQQRSDDTVSEIVRVRIDYDGAAVGIVNPKPNEQKPYTLGWQPTALFQSNGQDDLFNVPVRVQIRRCMDNMLVFQADSTIPALNTDENQQQFSFPSKQGSYDITKILPGCYTMCAMILYPADANHTNDTICSSFTVIDRLKGDYYVGVGQQFPTMQAAVDSMLFRGIGGNVRLILTDNNYTENGIDSASGAPLVFAPVDNYRQSNFTATWTDIATTGTAFSISPAYGVGYGSVTLPFDFPYNGTTIPSGTILHAGPCGAIGLDPTVTLPTSYPSPIPVAIGNATYPGLLCFFQGGGYASSNTQYYKVDGAAPNRVLTIEYSGWLNMGDYLANSSTAPPRHMQVKLYETSGMIEFIYKEHNLVSQQAAYYNCIGLNGLSATSHPSAPSFVAQAYPGYATLQASTPAADIRWTARVPHPTIGALDFQGIRDLADTATVTWIPNVGVTPRITFTGKKPFCFYFGDGFGGHMTFEGYNPAGAPIPDKLVAEPNKRGITIVNNSTSPGGIFAFEEGSSNITLKNLVLKNNGLFSNDSDAVVRIYNEQSRKLYTGTPPLLAPIVDTMPIHNIRVENCELGNAKYGIWDHALHTQFNIGKSVYVDWRNYNNTFTRNTIGTSASPISYTGIQFNNEQNLTISHNEVSNINGSLGGFPNVYGIDQPSVLQSDTGNIVGVWVDANKVHNLAATSTAYGIAFQQAATIYTVGSGPSAVHSILPTVTTNRTTNNMIFDLRGLVSNYPLTYTTSAATYSTDRDSIFNNSISTKNAAINIFVAQSKHAFLWNNIIQNTGAGPYTNYLLQLPRPFTSAISSDYNLFDLRGSNTFATVNEYDLNSGTLIQSRTFRRLNDWRTFTQQDSHSVTGDPLFASDSLHEPGALSYIESPASNSGAWLNTATQLRDFDGDLRLQGNQTPDIGADEFDGFQNTNDLATLSITTPAGYSATSDTTSVTIENPLYVNASVKNLSSQAIFNMPVSATVEVAISGGPWTTIYTGTTSPINFEVNETKSVTFQGPVITQAQAQTGVFRVTVTTPNDQNNANNVSQKVFRVLLKNNATLVSYSGGSPAGLRNRDSVTAALRRLGIAYDSLDRHLYSLIDVDYTP